MFLVSIASTIQQLNSIVPIYAVSSALIGGAYWPLEIVTSNAILLLSKLVPVTYAMKAIKDVILYEASWSDVVVPCFVLLFMGAIFIVIGLQLLERKAN